MIRQFSRATSARGGRANDRRTGSGISARPAAAVAAVSLTSILALSACGGSSEETNEADASSSTTSASASTSDKATSSSSEKPSESPSKEGTPTEPVPSEAAPETSAPPAEAPASQPPATQPPAENAQAPEAPPVAGPPADPRPADFPQDVPYPDYVPGLRAGNSATGYSMSSNSASRADADRLVADLKAAGFTVESEASSGGTYAGQLKRGGLTTQVVFEQSSQGFVYDVVGLHE